jgi:hypothetical protein
MAAAANIDEAIEQVVINIQGKNATLLTAFQSWLDKMFLDPTQFPTPADAWDEQDEDERTVRDWVHPSVIVQKNFQGVTGFPTAGSVLDQNNAIDVVERTLKAVKFANINSRISQSQEDDTVTIYNAVW